MTGQTVNEFVDEAIGEMVTNRTKQLSDVMEELREYLLSSDSQKQEHGVECVVRLVQKLPKDYLTEEQVSLLLDFFMGRLELSALVGGTVVEGIRHLMVESPNLSKECVRPIVQNLFSGGSVQSWPQQTRFHYYDIFEMLLTKFEDEMQSLGSEVTITFVNMMGGERDPRCLVKSFKLFEVVAKKYPLGVMVEDMFEVVACYYPVEFKPLPVQDSISRELLSSSCENCFLSNPAFAPFTFMMIEEKLTDEETKEEHKYEVCELLSKACSVFSASSILPHVEQLLGGLRAVGMHPKEKDAFNSRVRAAISDVIRTVKRGAPNKFTEIAKHLLENLEPFVLQAEMGLSDRALSFLEVVANEGCEEVVDRAISWIIMLVQDNSPSPTLPTRSLKWISDFVQGDTINTSANKTEIAQEGLLYLAHWVQLAKKLGYDLLLDRYSPSLFASIDVGRERVPSDSMQCMYKCAKIFLHVDPPCADRTNRFRSILEKGMTSVESDNERRELMSFISEYARTNWEELWNILQENFDKDIPKMFHVLCACVVDELSWNHCRMDIGGLWNPDIFSSQHISYCAMASRNGSRVAVLSTESFLEYIVQYMKDSDFTEDQQTTLQVLLQDLGLFLQRDDHTRISVHIMSQLSSHSSSHMLNICSLFLVQSTGDILDQCFSIASSDSLLKLFYFSIVNKGSAGLEDIPLSLSSSLQLSLRGKAIKGWMLSGNRKGTDELKKLFEDLLEDTVSSEECVSLLCDLFEFEAPASNPERCLYKASALWRQRIFCQFVPIYIGVLNRVNRERGDLRSALLVPLSSFLSFSKPISNVVEHQLEQLLPIFIDTLCTPEGVDVSPVLSALSPLLAISRVSDMQRDDVNRLVDSLRRIIQEENHSMVSLLDSLDSLDQIVRRIPSDYVLPHATKILIALTKQSGHKKRLVRQRAASVRNTWELLVTK